MNLQVVIRGLIFNCSDPYEVVAIDDVSFSRGCAVAVGGSTIICLLKSVFFCKSVSTVWTVSGHHVYPLRLPKST